MSKTSVIDLSGGDSHIREIAEESGINYLEYHSNEKIVERAGYKVEVWYNEDANSALSAWGAFIAGVGSKTAASEDEAINAIVDKAIKSV